MAADEISKTGPVVDEEMVRSLARLLDEPALGDRLGIAARRKVETHFDAAREARKLLELFAHASG